MGPDKEMDRFGRYMMDNINEFLTMNKQQLTSTTIVEKLTQLIIDKRLKAEDKLPSELERCKMLSVSRTSVREAMKILASQGLVEIKRGDGTYISSSVNEISYQPLFSQWLIHGIDIKDLLPVRRILEIGVLEEAMEKATTEDYDWLIAHNKRTAELIQLRDPSNLALILDMDMQFHKRLGQITGNPIMMRTINP